MYQWLLNIAYLQKHHNEGNKLVLLTTRRKAATGRIVGRRRGVMNYEKNHI